MPYTAEQRKLFHEMAENPEAARRHGTTQAEARKLAEEADRLPEKKAAQFIDLTPIFGGAPRAGRD